MVHSLAGKDEDSRLLHFVKASASQFDDGDEIGFTHVIVPGHDEDTISGANEEEIIYCDVDDGGPVKSSDYQPEENQSPYIYLKTEDYDAEGYLTEDIQSSDFEFSETFPTEAEVMRITEMEYEEALPLSEFADENRDEVSKFDAEEQNETFSCKVCDRSFGLERGLKRHMVVHKRKKTRVFPQKSRLQKRARIRRTEKQFSCARCSRSFAFIGNLKKHIATTHQNEEPVSSSTDASTVAAKLDLPGRTATGDHGKAITCEVCHQEFSQKSILKRHMMIHTNEKPFSCTLCTRTFARKDYLKKHTMIHIKDKPFRCTICKEIFTWKKNLQNHLMHHNTKRPFSCLVCSRSFVMKSHLKIHMLTHDEEKSYHCTTCSRSFTMKHHYTTHMLVHTNGKSFLCPVCGRSFTQRHIMHIHMKVHTGGEKTFICATCNRPFARKSDLKTHLLEAHKRVRRFSCSVCSRSFCSEKNLKSHMTTHGNNVIHYSCTVCKRSFTRKNHLRRHLMIHSNKLDL